MNEEEQKYFKGLIGFTFDSDDIKYKEIERLNNIIKRFEEDLREMYLTFGEFSEEYAEKKIKELKGSE